MQDRTDEALECFRRAAGLKPGYAEAHNNLGIAFAEQGRFAEAIAAFGNVVRLNPASADTLLPALRLAESVVVPAACMPDRAHCLNLDSIKRPGLADPQIAAMEALVQPGVEIPQNSRIALHFALGHAYDGHNRPDRAFAHFLEGNLQKRATLGYDEAAMLASMQHARQVFDAGLVGGLRGQGDASAAPIFILGMPRSGCNLLEQMLTAHPDVLAAGERSDFARLADAVSAREAITPTMLRQLGSDYLASINAKARRHARVTHRMVGNVLHAGLIHLALPNARIIHMRRGAADTCFSCYTRLFRIGHEYSFDLAELGRYFRACAHLMDHWRSVLPGSAMLDVEYEALIADPKGQIARVLDHCALPWSDSCVAGRASLHGRSIGRWQRYAAYLSPLLGELQKDVLF